MLQDFLDAKPLYYDEIDYTRMSRVYQKIKDHFVPTKIIHLVGTNGKGTTGRFLASSLHSMGYTVGHYTSPHILKFNERIWLNGSDVIDEVLEFHHDILQKILDDKDSESLSYFEYTTILAMLIFNTSDYIVLEAGLGGENDATAVFNKDLTLVTPIDYDHESFLGSDIKCIAQTKLNAIQNNAVIAHQIHDEVIAVANSISKKEEINIQKIDDLLNDNDKENISKIQEKLSLAPYLTQNLSHAIAAINFFNLNYELDDFTEAKLFGRLSKVKENIIVDVGHNTLAAKVILDALSPNKYILVYNSYQDKNYKKILSILKPLIIEVQIIEIQNQRVESLNLMQETLKKLDISYSIFEEVEDDKNYLVFGSFVVVEEFMKGYNG